MRDKVDLEDVLEELPFSRKSNQSEKLTDFFIANSSGTQEHVRKTTGISQPTIRRIKENFQELETAEKAVLIDHISNIIYGRALSREK